MCSGRSTIWYFAKYEPFNVGHVCVESCHCKTEYITVFTGHPEVLRQRERGERALLVLFQGSRLTAHQCLKDDGNKTDLFSSPVSQAREQRLSQVSQSRSAPTIGLMPPSQLLSGKWGALRPSLFLADPGSLATQLWDLDDPGVPNDPTPRLCKRIPVGTSLVVLTPHGNSQGHQGIRASPRCAMVRNPCGSSPANFLLKNVCARKQERGASSQHRRTLQSIYLPLAFIEHSLPRWEVRPTRVPTPQGVHNLTENRPAQDSLRKWTLLIGADGPEPGTTAPASH